jgi:hypothetical protein
MQKKLLLLVVFTLVGTGVVKAQTNYHHNVVWGRVALTDTITKNLRWEIYLQHRRQNTTDGKLDVFKAPQFISYWSWLTYTVNPKLRIAISPFGYFKSWILIADPSEIEREPITELRVALRLDQEQRLGKLIYTNRYSAEHRWRDLANNNVFQPNWRLRYQARLELPLKPSWLPRPVSLVAFDEIFIQFGKAVKGNPNVFDQNRIYGGLSYGLSDHVKMSLGYIYQIQQRNSGKEFDYANVLFGVLTFDNLFSQFRSARK